MIFGASGCDYPQAKQRQRRLWAGKTSGKCRFQGLAAGRHPQDLRPEPRVARGFQARKRARRLSERWCLLNDRCNTLIFNDFVTSILVVVPRFVPRFRVGYPGFWRWIARPEAPAVQGGRLSHFRQAPAPTSAASTAPSSPAPGPHGHRVRCATARTYASAFPWAFPSRSRSGCPAPSPAVRGCARLA